MNSTIFRWILVLISCAGCKPMLTTKSTDNTVTANVIVLRPGGPTTVRIEDQKRIALLEKWLGEVKPSQLPPEKLGEVGPWCTVTFYAGSTATSTNEIFAIDGKTTRVKLLTNEQRQKLIEIIDEK